jgi:hypothetical protein
MGTQQNLQRKEPKKGRLVCVMSQKAKGPVGLVFLFPDGGPEIHGDTTRFLSF